MIIYDPVKRTKFTVRHVKHKFKSVAVLRLALWQELLPEEGIGYFEGKSRSKKWLVTRQDLEAMHNHYNGKACISLWCDGRCSWTVNPRVLDTLTGRKKLIIFSRN